MIRHGSEPSTENGNLSAATFLGDVRAEFQALNQKLVGDIKRDPERDLAISLFVREYLSGKEIPNGFAAASERLLHRFEVLCARIGRSLHTTQEREPVYRILLDQLSDNIQRLGFKPGVLVTATLLNDASLSTLIEDSSLSSLLHEKRYLLKRAVESSPAHPREFLVSGVARLAELNIHLEKTGEDMHQQTRVKLAFLHRAQSIEDLMSDRKTSIENLLKEPEFRMLLANRRWLAVHAVDQFREDMVRPRLRQIHLCFAAVLANDAFAELRKRPGDIIVAAITHPRNTEKFLTDMLAREERLKLLMHELAMPMSDKELRSLCLRTPRRAGVYERQLREKLALQESGGSTIQAAS